MPVIDSQKKPNVFIAMDGLPRELSFKAVRALIGSGTVDDHGDDFVVIDGIRYEPLSTYAWIMYNECHPDEIQETLIDALLAN